MIHMLTGALAYRPAYPLVYLPDGFVPLVGVDPLLLSRVGPHRPVVGVGMPRRSVISFGSGNRVFSARTASSRTSSGPRGAVADGNGLIRRSGTADADTHTTVSCALAPFSVRPDDGARG